MSLETRKVKLPKKWASRTEYGWVELSLIPTIMAIIDVLLGAKYL